MGKLHPDKQVWELKRRGTPPRVTCGSVCIQSVDLFIKQTVLALTLC